MRMRGVGRWAGGWLWLRIRNEADRVFLERCLRCEGEWKEGLEVVLQGQTNGSTGTRISFELWEGKSRTMELLQFVTGWSVDLATWRKSEAKQRWYEIQDCRGRRQGELKSDKEYCESELEVQRSAAYLYVALAGMEDSPEKKSEPQPVTATPAMEKDSAHKKPFQFVLPRRSLRSGKLRAVRVGQIVNEVRTDILYNLLPVTLYAGANTEQRRRTSSNSVKESSDGIAKALGLLQLSCQYANYCVHELNRHSSKLESRQVKYVRKLNRLKHRQNLLDGQKANLRREAEVLSCSLDGMQSLLHELDPDNSRVPQTTRNWS